MSDYISRAAAQQKAGRNAGQNRAADGRRAAGGTIRPADCGRLGLLGERSLGGQHGEETS